ncbi:MAG: universal stress protein [Acidithiobacillus sp.]|nr:universal stress protein [Acidithiobacillus sp.]
MVVAFRKILAAVDFSKMAEQVLAHADREAQVHGASLTLVHVFNAQLMDLQLPEELLPNSLEMMDRLRQLAQERLEEQRRQSTLAQTQGVLLEKPGRIGPILCAYAEETKQDLIIIGNQQQGAIGRILLGSVANSVLQHAPCPVLVVGQKP